MKKTSISLQEAFDSTFHHKFNFDDFLSLNLAKEYKQLSNAKVNPSLKLKKYLRFLNSFVFDYAKINTNVVHSYRHEKSTYTAVVPHCHSKFFFQTDIKDFFHKITKQDVEKILDTALDNAPIYDINKYKPELLNITTIDGILPVGFPTSPNISNSFLSSFDHALEEYCIKNEIIYTRYSDDIILSSNSKDYLISIQDIISDYLNELYDGRVKINAYKTKHTHKGSKIKILGMVILPSGKISVDIKFKQHLEILFHFYINDKNKFADYLKNHYQGDFSKISGQLNHINTIDKSYLDKLRKRYGNFIVDSFHHRSID
ncbi:MAG: reverse transcriptase domain-containing protein [Methylomicrobium sp.]